MHQHDVLPGRKPSKIRDRDLDEEAATPFPLSCDVEEAGLLRRLRRQIPDRVEYYAAALADQRLLFIASTPARRPSLARRSPVRKANPAASSRRSDRLEFLGSTILRKSHDASAPSGL